MAPTPSRAKKSAAAAKKNKKSKKSTMSHESLLETASNQLKLGNIDEAAAAATAALASATASGSNTTQLQCLNLLGQISIEAGEPDNARALFTRAVALDPEGAQPEAVGGGPEKFMWLAQLSEEGGRDSVSWYEKAARALRAQIANLQAQARRTDDDEAALLEKQRALAGVLCAVTEVFMTDLSWEEDAEQQCEALVTEASTVCPSSAETWQTVANVRISQQRDDEAREALKRGLEIWADLPSNDPSVPEFAVRISLARLLLEVAMMEEARFVLDRLIKDDDQSVEAWYLGGWHRFLVGQKSKEEGNSEEHVQMWKAARRRLIQCAQLYQMLQYDDERLAQHAQELLDDINKELGEPTTEDEETEAEEEEGEDDEDDEMQE
ncbi:hypothetical protein TD95_003797 [Thielaviopsis punctulata]|uniref:Uncharacterized protein n=1 Tax=Thielaviopsis punctulata TaxID=72032 RepID=A0A0F4ZET6_9PEZI|nr:hypothetical protein TD95_003797 [Thielaviopsis punctulata]